MTIFHNYSCLWGQHRSNASFVLKVLIDQGYAIESKQNLFSVHAAAGLKMWVAHTVTWKLMNERKEIESKIDLTQRPGDVTVSWLQNNTSFTD